MLLGYNTNGFGFHRLDDALAVIAETGYSCVALTLDVHHADPFTMTANARRDLKKRLADLGLACVIETGARFLLDPRRKHRPTLLDADCARRREFLRLAMQLAGELEATCVSYWSGARPDGASATDDELFKRLAHHVVELESEAASRGVRLAFEPEPGFLVESMADYDRLCALTGRRIGLTLDIGHLQCVEKQPPATFIARYADALINVQLDDMKRGKHQHLMFGEGEVDVPSVFRALGAIGYKGPACVELSDASRNAPACAGEAFRFLSPLMTSENR